MEFKELVSELKEFYGVKSLEAVAEKMGYTTHSATDWRRKKNLSAHALIKYQQDRQKKGLDIVTDSPRTFKVRYYPFITASAGYGIVPDSDLNFEEITLEEAVLLNAKVQNKNNLDILKIEGDSMTPFLRSGDKVIVERECKAKNGDVVIAIVGDSLYVKRLHMHPLGHWVKLISDNERYNDIELKDQEIQQMQIVAIVRVILRVM